MAGQLFLAVMAILAGVFFVFAGVGGILKIVRPTPQQQQPPPAPSPSPTPPKQSFDELHATVRANALRDNPFNTHDWNHPRWRIERDHLPVTREEIRSWREERRRAKDQHHST